MLKVLVIGYVWPEPNSSAAGSQMMQLLEFFIQQAWQVHFASPAAITPHQCELQSLGITVNTISLNDSTFDRYISSLKPNMVVFDRFMMEEQFAWRVEKNCPAAIRILHTVDLHCLRLARQHAVKQKRDMNQQDLMSDTALREIACILRCDLSLLISEFELNLLINTFNIDANLLHHVPFMLDTISHHTRQQWPTFNERQHFISIGNFRHAPNWDAVLYLKESIWPLIRQQLPAVEMHIYGAYPPQKATQCHQPKQKFHVLGWADNAHKVMQQARICLAPLRFGAGIKGKLVEAMLCGTPSITSTIGAEAMHGNLPWNGCITNDTESFANAAVHLYQHQASWREAQQNGIAIVKQHYDKHKISAKLRHRLDNLNQNITQHRLNNFIGAMLRHHTMKSTQYMSRWIETKNTLQSLLDN